MLTNLVALACTAALSVTGSGTDPSTLTAETRSGVFGRVMLGPTCPVETVDDPCADRPAAHVKVTVSEQIAGESDGAGPAVATTRTDAKGRYRVAVPPGNYVVTAKAGMSCEFMDASVRRGTYTHVRVPCDTGIR